MGFAQPKEVSNTASRQYFPRRYSAAKHAIVVESDDWPNEDETRYRQNPITVTQCLQRSAARLQGVIMAVLVFTFLLGLLLSTGSLLVPHNTPAPAMNTAEN